MGFSNSHRSTPSPYRTNNIGRVYPEFFSLLQLCIGCVEGELQENFKKGCTILRGNRELTEAYEYCSTVPMTFVQDCRLVETRFRGHFKANSKHHFFPLDQVISFTCRFLFTISIHEILVQWAWWDRLINNFFFLSFQVRPLPNFKNSPIAWIRQKLSHQLANITKKLR